jgi:hypothetical protein
MRDMLGSIVFTLTTTLSFLTSNTWPAQAVHSILFFESVFTP